MISRDGLKVTVDGKTFDAYDDIHGIEPAGTGSRIIKTDGTVVLVPDSVGEVTRHWSEARASKTPTTPKVP